MPWNQNDGGWKGGPWGQGPTNGGGQPPKDLEEILRRNQNKLKEAMPGGVGPFGWFFIFLIILSVLGYLGFTVRINPDEVGVVQRFGKLDRQVFNGLNFRWPYPVEDVTIVPYTRQNRVEIGSASQSDLSLSHGDESQMLTGDENIVDVNFTVLWNVKDAAGYLFNVKQNEIQPDGSLNATRNVKAVAETSMREVIGKRDLKPILTQSRQEIEDAVKAHMQETLDRYGAGIFIIKVNLQKVDPPGAVIDASRDVQAARADQERLINEAKQHANKVVPEVRGQRQRILQDAQGYKERVINEARGSTDRFLKIYEEYVKAPDVTRRRMYLETMEHILAGVDKTIIDDKTSTSGVVPYLPLGGGDAARTNSGQSGGQK